MTAQTLPKTPVTDLHAIRVCLYPDGAQEFLLQRVYEVFGSRLYYWGVLMNSQNFSAQNLGGEPGAPLEKGVAIQHYILPVRAPFLALCLPVWGCCSEALKLKLEKAKQESLQLGYPVSTG